MIEDHTTEAVNDERKISDTPGKEFQGVWHGAWEAIGETFDRIKRSPWPALLMIVVTAVAGFVDDYYNKDGETFPVGPSFVAFLVFLVFAYTYVLGITDGKKMTVGKSFVTDARTYVRTFFGTIFVGFATTLSVLALVFPAIWVIPWLRFVMLIIRDQNVPISQAIKESYRLADDNKAKIWGIYGATILLALPLVIGAVVMASYGLITFENGVLQFTTPVIWGVAVATLYSTFLQLLSDGASARLYRWLQANVAEEPVSEPAARDN